MGWVATAIMLYGSYLVGEKNKVGFVCQITGNLLWAYVGVTRDCQLDLIVVSLAFCVLYIRNYFVWWKTDKDERSGKEN